MPKLQVSQRGRQVIASPIRKFLPLMQAAEKRGVKVYKLNTGDPDLAVPPEFFHAVRNFKDKNLHYAPSPGFPSHVAAWIKYYRQFGVSLRPEHILPTVGCAEAILLAMQAVADEGDEILVFEPVYVSYKSFGVMTGIKLVPVTLKADNNFQLPPTKAIAKKITKRTKAIVVINPDNPTGKLWSRQELLTVLGLARKHNLFVIADETYREIRFSGLPYSMLAEKPYRDLMVLTDSVSKRFSMPGARIGCVASFNAEIMQALLKFAQARLSVGTLEQYGLIPLLNNSRRFVAPAVREYQKRRDTVYRELSKVPGVICNKPNGAFYLYAALPVQSAEDFVKFLIRDFKDKGETVMISPMQDFYITPGLGKNEIRIAYVLNSGELKRAMQILAKALEAYRGKK